jgi:hypothetical protein
VKEPLRETRSESAAATWRIECNAVAARRKVLSASVIVINVPGLVITVEYGGALVRYNGGTLKS